MKTLWSLPRRAHLAILLWRYGFSRAGDAWALAGDPRWRTGQSAADAIRTDMVGP